MPKKYREIIKSHYDKYENKLELTIFDRYLSKIFTTNELGLKIVKDDEEEEDIIYSTSIYGGQDQIDNVDNYYVAANDLRFPYVELFKDLYIEKNPNYIVDYLNVGGLNGAKVLTFKEDTKEKLYIFIEDGMFNSAFSYYDSVEKYDYEGDSTIIIGDEEKIKHDLDRNIIGDDLKNTLLALAMNENYKKDIHIVLIPWNIKTDITPYVHIMLEKFDKRIKQNFRLINSKASEQLKIDYVDYFQLVDLEFPDKTNDFIISRYIKIYEKYNEYFRGDFLGNIIKNHKTFLVEEFKISSNLEFGTTYPIEIEKTIANHVNKLKDSVDFSPTWSYNDIIDEIIEENTKATEYKENYDLLYDENIYKMIITSEWLYKEIENKNYFDNSAVTSGYLKSVELILYKLLSKHNKLDHRSTIGFLIKFLKDKNYRSKDKLIPDKTVEDLIQWNIEVRNGFFHKDVMDKNEVEDVRKRTFLLIFNLLNSNL